MSALVGMAAALLVVLLATAAALSGDLGKSKKKVKFTTLLSKSPEINRLSAARLFLFASRDIWFVVGLPVFLSQIGCQIGLSALSSRCGSSAVLIQRQSRRYFTCLVTRQWMARRRACGLLYLCWYRQVSVGMSGGIDRATVVMIGLAVFAVVFAINSAVHSYLVLAYSDRDRVALDVGFYYMANAGGRLLGTLASGVVFQFYGLTGCLWGAAIMVLAAAVHLSDYPKGIYRAGGCGRER